MSSAAFSEIQTVLKWPDQATKTLLTTTPSEKSFSMSAMLMTLTHREAMVCYEHSLVLI